MHRLTTDSLPSARLDAGDHTSHLSSRYELVNLPCRSPPLVTGVLPSAMTTIEAVEDMTREAQDRGVEKSILLHSGAHAEASIAAIKERLPHSAVAHMHIAQDAPSLENVRALHDSLRAGAMMVGSQTPALLSLLKPMMEQRVLAEEAVRLKQPCPWRRLNDPVIAGTALTDAQCAHLRQHAHHLVGEVDSRLPASRAPKDDAASRSRLHASAVAEEPLYAVPLPKSKRPPMAARPASPVAEDGAPGRSAKATRPTEAFRTPPSRELESNYASISPYAEPPDLPPQRTIEAPVQRAAFAVDGGVVGGLFPGRPFRPLPALPGTSAPAQTQPDARSDIRLHLGLETMLREMVRSFVTERPAGAQRLWRDRETFGSPVAMRDLQEALATHKNDVSTALINMRTNAMDMSDDAFATALKGSVRQLVSSEVLSPKEEKRLKRRVSHLHFTEAMQQISIQREEDRLALKTAVHPADRPARLRAWLQAVFDGAVLEGLMNAGAKER